MQNLAGDVGCDRYILYELIKAGVEIVEHPEPLPREVPARLTGVSGDFTFKRAWYYWVVDGVVPLYLAEIMYKHPRGVDDVRVAGMAGNDEPKKWAIRGSIYTYHIDSQSGLNYFCDTLRDAAVIPPWPTTDYSELRERIIKESYDRREKYHEERRAREEQIRAEQQALRQGAR